MFYGACRVVGAGQGEYIKRENQFGKKNEGAFT